MYFTMAAVLPFQDAFMKRNPFVFIFISNFKSSVLHTNLFLFCTHFFLVFSLSYHYSYSSQNPFRAEKKIPLNGTFESTNRIINSKHIRCVCLCSCNLIGKWKFAISFHIRTLHRNDICIWHFHLFALHLLIVLMFISLFFTFEIFAPHFPNSMSTTHNTRTQRIIQTFQPKMEDEKPKLKRSCFWIEIELKSMNCKRIE